MKLAPDLNVVAYGGASPGTVEGEVIWKGFPFETDTPLETAYEKLLLKDEGLQFKKEENNESLQIKRGKEKDAKLVSDKTSLILLTHCGPSFTSTTLHQRKNDKPIQSGSEGLRKVLTTEKAQNHVLLNIHGHTHSGVAMHRLENVSVLNVGALKFGRFGFVTFYKPLPSEVRTSSFSWDFGSVEFHKL